VAPVYELAPDKVAVPGSDFVRAPLPAKTPATVTVVPEPGFNV